MTKLNFEGDLKDISEKQLNFIANVLEGRGYINEKVTIAPVGQAGDNYVANVKRITVEKDGKIFKMVAKVAPHKELLRTTMNTTHLFYNEHIIYTKLFPKYAELEEAANLPKSERLRFAKCYGSSTEKLHEIIIFEDLKLSNFIIFDRLVSLTDECVKLTLRSFAILHSLSYALKHQEPEIFEEFGSKLKNMFEHFSQIEAMQVYVEILEKEVLNMLDNDGHKNMVKGAVSQLSAIAMENLKIDRESKYCVIQQGDSWTNNIMFRVEDNKPVECCMIDYQLCNKSSPAADLGYMIFNCTDYNTRSKYYHEWIDYYYNELDKRLSSFGLRANLIYPRDQLDADLRRHGQLSLGTSIMLASMLMRETKEAAVYQDAIDNELSVEEITDVMKIANMEEASFERFKNRVEGLIESFADLGYLVPNH